MVQTYQSPVRIYKYPFEIVMAAYQKRFPTCAQISIFVGSEITSEYHSPDGAVEIIDRKCQLNVDAPYSVKKIAGVDYVYFLDRRNRTLDIEATNISFGSRIDILEKCIYYVYPENKEWTCFEQSASMDVKSFFGFETTVEKLAVKQYAANLAKGKEILEFFIEDLLKTGTTFIPPFQVSDSTQSPGDSAIDVSKIDAAGDDQESESQTETQKEPIDRRLSTSHATTAAHSAVSQITRRQSTTSGTPKPTTSRRRLKNSKAFIKWFQFVLFFLFMGSAQCFIVSSDVNMSSSCVNSNNDIHEISFVLKNISFTLNAINTKMEAAAASAYVSKWANIVTSLANLVLTLLGFTVYYWNNDGMTRGTCILVAGLVAIIVFVAVVTSFNADSITDSVKNHEFF